MKLTIVRLNNFSAQDLIDLGKIWPEYSASSLSVDETHRIYAARFNERSNIIEEVKSHGRFGK